MKLFLKIENFKGYDVYYQELEDTDNWNDILDVIQSVLDEKFSNNNDSIIGLKLNCEIVTLTKEQQVEMESLL